MRASPRRYWLDHFTGGDPSVVATFLSLKPEDCAPLLEALDLPRVPGEDFESAENRVYGFGDVVLKFFRPGRWSLAALQDEVDFLDDLLAAGVSVVRPLRGPETWRGMHYIAYEAVPKPYGTDRETLDPPSLRAFVHLVARLHQVGAQREARHRPRLAPSGTCMGLLDVIAQCGMIPADRLGAYGAQIERLAERLAEVTAGVPMQRIHNDPGSWNVLWRPEGPLLMDLDDFDVGPVAIDLAVMHFPWRLSTLDDSVTRDQQWPIQRAKVLEYYREVNDFPEAWEAMFEPMRALRGLFFDAWFSARWNDPGFSASYPKDDPTDPGWWDLQIKAMEEKLAR